MFPMMGYYGMNPFGCWEVSTRPEVGFFLGLAAATAVQTSYAATKTHNQQPQNQTQSTNTNQSVGNFGSLTASLYNNNNTGFGYFGSFDNTMPYYPTTFITPDVAITAANLADRIVNNINTQMQAVAQAQAQAQAQAAQSQSASQSSDTLSSASQATVNEPQGAFLKGKGRGTKYGPEFLEKVKQISQRLNCNYRDLLAIFNSEFGVEANKTAQNGAVGLICFMPQYFDTRKIVQMSPIEQLDIVEQTIMRSKKQAGFAQNSRLSKEDLYALVFLPARANSEVLCRKGEGNRFYESNAALDYNRDGQITKSEMAHRIDSKYVSDQSFLA